MRFNEAVKKYVSRGKEVKLPEWSEPLHVTDGTIERISISDIMRPDWEPAIPEHKEPIKPQQDAITAYSIPVIDGQYPVTVADYDAWRALFVGVDIDKALRTMTAWCLANPSRRKTSRGVRRFIVNWLTREQDKGVMLQPGTPYRRADSPRQAVQTQPNAQSFFDHYRTENNE